jgi:hypothetical protein
MPYDEPWRISTEAYSPDCVERLFSLVTVFAHRRMAQAAGVFGQVAWYHKRHPTFADELAMVRKEFVGPGADFLRIEAGDRHDRSPKGVCGTT